MWCDNHHPRGGELVLNKKKRNFFTINQKPFEYLKHNLQRINNFDKQINRSEGRKTKHKDFILVQPSITNDLGQSPLNL